jgi:teichuronic acid biosynthesis glycosyltransferase TuaG
MPAFNAGATIEESISSVLAQIDSDCELVIVDDCSSERPDEIYSKYSQESRVKIVLQDLNCGPGSCRNIGLQRASGRFIHFLDADDFVFPSYTSLLQDFHQVTGSSLCCSSYIRCGSFRDLFLFSSVVSPPGRIDYNNLKLANRIPLLTASIDRDSVHIVPFIAFDDKKRLSRPEDYLFWIDLFTANPGLIARTLKHPLAFYRVSRKSRSANKYATIRRQYELRRTSFSFPYLRSILGTLAYCFYSSRGKSALEVLDSILP